jgi:hypothetical protein
MKGGHATISKVHIEVAQEIKPFWEFMANQNESRLDLAKLVR